MAGITANSASKSMLAGDTAADQRVTGFRVAEQITLGTSPAGTDYSWGIALPSGSASARAGLNSTTAAGPVFTPDVAGDFTITADVDGATYVLRCAVVEAQTAEAVQGGLQFSQTTDASIATPGAGALRVYLSSDQGTLATKDSSGNIAAAGRIPTARITSTDSPYTIAMCDAVIFADTDGGAITVNLPAGASGAHQKIVNCGTSGHDVTVDGDGTEQVRGAATQAVTDGNQIDLHYDATEGWW